MEQIHNGNNESTLHTFATESDARAYFATFPVKRCKSWLYHTVNPVVFAPGVAAKLGYPVGAVWAVNVPDCRAAK